MPSDADFLGLTPAGPDGHYQFTVSNHLARLDGKLYGGTAIAVSITAAELVSGRPGLWMTTQFVSTAPADATISVVAEVLAPGRRTNQVRITGTDESGDVMFASLGATGHHRPDGLTGTFENPPEVSAPVDSVSWATPFMAVLRNAGVNVELPAMPSTTGFASVLEFREPTIHQHPDPGPGRICVWVRRRDGKAVTPAMAAYIADMVPLSVAHACGAVAGGISLDNTIRIGSFEPTEWVLVDLRPHMAVGDYGHGAAHIWSETGHLLATASQTASMLHFDISSMPGTSA